MFLIKDLFNKSTGAIAIFVIVTTFYSCVKSVKLQKRNVSNVKLITFDNYGNLLLEEKRFFFLKKRFALKLDKIIPPRNVLNNECESGVYKIYKKTVTEIISRKEQNKIRMIKCNKCPTTNLTSSYKIYIGEMETDKTNLSKFLYQTGMVYHQHSTSGIDWCQKLKFLESR